MDKSVRKRAAIAAAATSNDTYSFTDAQADGRALTITDTNGGYDTIDLSHITQQARIDLSGINSSAIGASTLTISDDHIWTIVGGSNDDDITGSTLDSRLYGGGGDDFLESRGAVAILDGGAGDDYLEGQVSKLAIARYAGAFADYQITQHFVGWSSFFVTDRTGAEGTDELAGVEVALFSDGAYILNASDGTTTKLFGADAVIGLDPVKGVIISDTSADISASLPKTAGFLATIDNAADLIAAINFTDENPTLYLNDVGGKASSFAAFQALSDQGKFAGSFKTVYTLSDGRSQRSIWNGSTRLITTYLDADGTLTRVDQFRILGKPFDSTISFYDASKRRTEIDFYGRGTLLYKDQLFADGRRVRITTFTNRAYTEERLSYDTQGDLTQQLTTGYTNGVFTSRLRTFDAAGTLLTDRLDGYQGNAATNITYVYRDGEIVQSILKGVVGQSYTGLIRSYDADSKLSQVVYEDYDRTRGEKLTVDYAGNLVTERRYTGLTGRAYTTLTQDYGSDGKLDQEVRTGYSGTGYSSLTTVYKADGKTVDHSVYALDTGDFRIVGTAGNDTLRGGAHDILVGLAGADTFAITGSGAVVQDFKSAQNDKFDLSGLFGNRGGSFDGTGEFNGSANEVRYATNGFDATVFVDLDGNKTADLSFTVKNTTTLAGSDFILAAAAG